MTPLPHERPAEGFGGAGEAAQRGPVRIRRRGREARA